MYLVDTNVISAFAPTKRAANAELAKWMDRAGPKLFLSAITHAEIAAGIAKAEREGATKRAASLREWWAAIVHLYGDRVLPFDSAAAEVAGTIIDRARAHDPGFEDIAIAATARSRGLEVLTANERHFVPLGVPVRNPFKALPPLG
jgi:predicted nucleic acid-binding protein